MRMLARSLYRAALLRREHRHAKAPRSVLHVSPLLFGPEGLVGGGERAAYGYASAISELLPTTLVTTGRRRERRLDGNLRIEIYPSPGFLRGQRFDPVCYRFLEQVRSADVVHCHLYRVAMSQLAILTGASLGKRTFVTDMGGVGTHFDPETPVERCLSGVIAISDFSRRLLPADVPALVAPTGVGEPFLDADEPLVPDTSLPRRVLYVGRIMRHKGIDVLIEALPKGVGLDIVGRVYDEEFYELLRLRAEGLEVRFVHDATDEDLVRAYRQALVTVLPSVYEDVFGGRWELPELLGCVLQESMACGTPAICSDVGGMPEVVEDGVTGWIVPPSDPAALGQRISQLLADPGLRARMGRHARDRVLRRFTWPTIARRVLNAYETL
jgi:glycosyltransferase involved in cell wall biosynthesis